MAAVILSEFDINKMDTASKAWAYAGLAPIAARRCNLCHTVVVEKGGKFMHPDVSDICDRAGSITIGDTYESGQAMRPTKGEKLTYNKFLRTKLIGVLAPVLLKSGRYRCLKCNGVVTIDKAASKGKRGDAIKMYKHSGECDCVDATKSLSGDDVVFSDRPHFVKSYDDYKHRKLTAGWGRSDAHRHQAAMRYMIKMLLLQLWKDWREFEHLPVRPSYQEEKQGHTHSSGVKSESRQEDAHDEECDLDRELALANGDADE